MLPAVFRIQSEALITQESEWVNAFREGNNLYRQVFFCFFYIEQKQNTKTHSGDSTEPNSQLVVWRSTKYIIVTFML